MFFAVQLLLGLVLLIALYFCVWLQYHYDAFLYKTQCKDKKWVPLPDQSALISESSVRASKTLYLIRHGESTWNLTFNRNKLFFLPVLVYTLIYETYLAIVSGDSWLYDSPLCREGVKQANTVREFLQSSDSEDTKVLMRAAGSKSSIIVCSNLRRCISTVLVALYDRLRNTEEQVVVLPHLQEITDNPDALSITEPFETPQPSWFDKGDSIFKELGMDMRKMYATALSPSENTGNKTLDSNGLKRMESFNNWLFTSVHEDVVIVCGHSLWFRSYLKQFLPTDFNHIGKKNKMKNGGVVKCIVDFHIVGDKRALTAKQKFVQIRPDSVAVVHGGFKK